MQWWSGDLKGVRGERRLMLWDCKREALRRLGVNTERAKLNPHNSYHPRTVTKIVMSSLLIAQLYGIMLILPR